MSFSSRLRQSLDAHLKSQVKYLKNWDKDYTGPWKGPGLQPVALVLHHTAGAATTSRDPKNKGNQPGANNGVVNYVQSHFRVPAANFTIDRDGSVFVHAANPVWHAGLGEFGRLSKWRSLRIPKDDGNRWMLGVEIISRGLAEDYTDAQIDAVVKLARACRDAAGWQDTSTLRLPRHRDWAPRRKVDIVYSNQQVQRWFAERPEVALPLWDGRIPRYMAVIKAQREGIANPAVHRLATRLADLGFLTGSPDPVRVQKYPRDAVARFQNHHGIKVAVPGDYDAITHRQLFKAA